MTYWSGKRRVHVPVELRTGSEEASAVRSLYERVGCKVYETSDKRRVLADPGIADLIVFCPRRRNTMLGMWWHESKAGRGQQTEDQRKFQLTAESCGQRYVLGGEPAAREFLEEIGILLSRAL